MNAEMEIAELKQRISLLERICLRPRAVVKAKLHLNNEAIALTAIHFIAEKFRMSPDDLRGHRRTWRLVWPRWIVMWLAVKYSGITQQRLAKIFGRDHTSISHGIDGVEREMETNPEQRIVAESLEAEFKILIEPENNPKEIKKT